MHLSRIYHHLRYMRWRNILIVHHEFIAGLLTTMSVRITTDYMIFFMMKMDGHSNLFGVLMK